ncbi:MAG TPA: insulinase family protein [Sphingomonadaceae bacterium]|nr:insulinase family protein [Sphingomonadaceae bacterium]
MRKIFPVGRIFAVLSGGLLLLAPIAHAQEQQAPVYDLLPAPRHLDLADPWIYRGTDIPHDERWLFGELDNGLRYAVARNLAPPGQASIRIRIDAGRLHEEEDEQGFAHLVEHLSFRESKYLRNAEAIPTWQRLGARFGDDTNAQTTATETVYKIDLPDASRTRLEETVRLLSGMIREPALSEENLAAEVPIVLAEFRDNGGSARRVVDQMQSLFYQGQRLGERTSDAIPPILTRASSEQVKAFHRRWYRPENTVVVIAGDGPPETYAALIERYFADWQVPGEPTPQPDFGVPRPSPGNDVKVAVEPDMPRSATWVYLRPWEEVVDNLEYNRGKMIDFVAEMIVNRRLEAKARESDSFLFANAQREDLARSVDVTFVTVGPKGKDWQKAMRDVRSVIEDAMASPPSEEEIAREIAAIDVIFADQLEQAINRPSPELADEVVGAVDIREAVASPETFLTVFRDMRHRFTPEAVLEHTRETFSSDVVRGFYVTPAIGEADAGQLRLALTEPVAGDPSARMAGAGPSFEDLPPIGIPVQALSEEDLGVAEIKKITFTNGVKALVWRTENEPGRITVRVRFGSGYRGFSEADAPYISLGEYALVSSGFGDVGEAELERLVNGRKLGFQFTIGDGVFQFEGQTRPEDLADQLYLFAAKLSDPAWKPGPVERVRSLLELDYDSHNVDPMSVLERDLYWLVNNRDGRFATPTPEQLRSTTPAGFRAVWEPLLKQGPIEVMVFGDIDHGATLEALSRTFGALGPRDPIPPEVLAKGVSFPAPQPTPEILFHRGEADQAAAVVAWKLGGGSDGLSEARQIEVLADVFSNRLIDALRERAGASYSPYVASDWPVDIDSGGVMLALAQLPPEMVGPYFDMVDAIAADLAANGPSAEELERVIEPNRQFLNRAVYGHLFWMNRVEGATTDPARLASIGSIMADLTRVTPDRIRQLARTYLVPGQEFKLGVLPEGQQFAAGLGDLPERP